MSRLFRRLSGPRPPEATPPTAPIPHPDGAEALEDRFSAAYLARVAEMTARAERERAEQAERFGRVAVMEGRRAEMVHEVLKEARITAAYLWSNGVAPDYRVSPGVNVRKPSRFEGSFRGKPYTPVDPQYQPINVWKLRWYEDKSRPIPAPGYGMGLSANGNLFKIDKKGVATPVELTHLPIKPAPGKEVHPPEIEIRDEWSEAQKQDAIERAKVRSVIEEVTNPLPGSGAGDIEGTINAWRDELAKMVDNQLITAFPPPPVGL